MRNADRDKRVTCAWVRRMFFMHGTDQVVLEIPWLQQRRGWARRVIGAPGLHCSSGGTLEQIRYCQLYGELRFGLCFSQYNILSPVWKCGSQKLFTTCNNLINSHGDSLLGTVHPI